MDELQDLINESERMEQYWQRMSETLSIQKEKMEKNGGEPYDRIQDLLDMSVQQYHLFNALIVELNIVKHG